MTRLCFISDTHELHAQLTQSIAAARPDVLVHCGDFTGIGALPAVRSFADWCAMLVAKGYAGQVVCIAGNHDLSFDQTHPKSNPAIAATARAILAGAGITYLQDSDAEIEGLAFWGSPWTRRFYDWAFQIDTPAQDEAIHERIPLGVDILVTHGPPCGIRDLVPRGEHIGSEALANHGAARHPRIHAFGHYHGGYGITLGAAEHRNGARTLHVNASTCTEAYKPTNQPIVVDLESDE